MSAGPFLFGTFCLDPVTQRFWRGSELVPLRAKTFSVLQYLAENPERLVTHGEIRRAVWPDTAVTEGLLRGYIRELRRLLGDSAHCPRFIETVPRRGYRFVAQVARGHSVVSRPTSPPRSHGGMASSLVGRDPELAKLCGWLDLALAGQPQVVFVAGEQGIGKTAVLRALLDRARADDATLVATGHSIDLCGEGEAYLPVFHALGRLCGGPGSERVVRILEQHAPSWLLQMPGIIGEHRLAAVRRRLEGATRARMLRELVEALEALVRERPIVLALEDLQWSDPSTLDLLLLFARLQEPMRFMVVCTYRPAAASAPGHPLRRMVGELRSRGECQELHLGPLDEGGLVRYLDTRFPGNDFARDLAPVVYRSTEGNPLFFGAVTDDLVDRGLVCVAEQRWRLQTGFAEGATLAPEGLCGLIEGMIERLPEIDQRILEASSLVGADFTAGPIAAALQSAEDEIEERCKDLARGERFLRLAGSEAGLGGAVHSRFAVVHLLYHHVARDRCTPARQQLWHRRIGECIEAEYSTRVADFAGRLALHFERGGDAARAVRYHAVASERAMARFARGEAIGHLTSGLELLRTLPDGRDRDERELSMLTHLGRLMSATRGFVAPEVEAINARSFALVQKVGETLRTCQVLYSTYVSSVMQCKFRRASVVADQLYQIARGTHDPSLLGVALVARASPILFGADFEGARDLLVEAKAIFDAERERPLVVFTAGDPALSGTLQLALVEWTLGHPDRALKTGAYAIEVAKRTSNPFAEVAALASLSHTHAMRRETAASEEMASRALGLMKDRDFPYLHGEATMLSGCAQMAHGNAGGQDLVRAGLSERLGAASAGTGWFLTRAAEAYRSVGEVDRGLRAIDDALRSVREREEWAWEGEALRERADLLVCDARRQPSRSVEILAEAKGCAMRALDLARAQSAKMPELRAAATLTRLGLAVGGSQDARRDLAEAYGWFQEGHDLPDLVEAEALLGEAAPRPHLFAAESP